MLENCSIILCEGDINSLDYQIYSKLFANKKVIPCGSNSILKVKEEKLKGHENVCAITDRDVLSSSDIEDLLKEDIYTLKVRAIENVLVIDLVLNYICKKENIKEFETVTNNIKHILFNKYGKRLNKQFEFNINDDNILKFYNPKKVIDTVALMLNMSKREYLNSFFDILEDHTFSEKIKRCILDIK